MARFTVDDLLHYTNHQCLLVQILTLVNELIEGVLTVRSRLTPYNGARVVGDPTSSPRYVFAVRLHVPLLEVGSESMHVLSEKHTPCFCTTFHLLELVADR